MVQIFCWKEKCFGHFVWIDRCFKKKLVGIVRAPLYNCWKSAKESKFLWRMVLAWFLWLVRTERPQAAKTTKANHQWKTAVLRIWPNTFTTQVLCLFTQIIRSSFGGIYILEMRNVLKRRLLHCMYVLSTGGFVQNSTLTERTKGPTPIFWPFVVDTFNSSLRVHQWLESTFAANSSVSLLVPFSPAHSPSHRGTTRFGVQDLVPQTWPVWAKVEHPLLWSLLWWVRRTKHREKTHIVYRPETKEQTKVWMVFMEMQNRPFSVSLSFLSIWQLPLFGFRWQVFEETICQWRVKKPSSRFSPTIQGSLQLQGWFCVRTVP